MKSRPGCWLGIFVLILAGWAQAAGGQGAEPARGSPERKAILDALRKEVQQLHKLDVIFVTRYLRVKNGWGWVEVDPQSPDSRSQYEPIAAAMRQGPDGWKVSEIACAEEGNPNCLDSPKFPGRLERRHRGFPLEILPASRS